MSTIQKSQDNGLEVVFTYNKRVEIISFFIEHPDESFRSSEIIEQADISKGTWHNENKNELLDIGIIETIPGTKKYILKKDHPLTHLIISIYYYPQLMID